MADNLNRHAIEILIAKARSKKGQQIELADERESGLRVRAGERSVTWLLNVRLRNGKRSRIKLGAWPAMGISDARRAAQTVKLEVATGLDPNEEKRESARQAAEAASKRRTLGEVLDQYETMKLVQQKRGADVRRALDGKMGLLRPLVSREPSSIERSEIAELVRNHAKRAPIAANRCLAYTNAFFNWCVAEEVLEKNPARNISKPAKERQRDRYHSMEELREIWQAAGTLGYPFGPLFRLLIVLPMRKSEVTAMPISELDISLNGPVDEAVWILAANRTKRENALRVPLSHLAQSLITEAITDPIRPPDSPYVFSMTGDTPVSGFGRAKRRLDAAIQSARENSAEGRGAVEPMAHWTSHDLRTTFNTQACEVLGIDIAVADRILNHVASATTSKIMRVYNKSEMFEPRKRALNDWAELIEQRCF